MSGRGAMDKIKRSKFTPGFGPSSPRCVTGTGVTIVIIQICVTRSTIEGPVFMELRMCENKENSLDQNQIK